MDSKGDRWSIISSIKEAEGVNREQFCVLEPQWGAALLGSNADTLEATSVSQIVLLALLVISG